MRFFGKAFIGSSGDQYAAQDFESPIPENLAFSYSEQVGDVFLNFASITESGEPSLNDGEENFEIYSDGLISMLDKSVSHGSVKLGIGYIFPLPSV